MGLDGRVPLEGSALAVPFCGPSLGLLSVLLCCLVALLLLVLLVSLVVHDLIAGVRR